jgi:molecular chaperone Hsp33
VHDALTSFLLAERGARGAVVDIRNGVDAMLGLRDYPASVRTLVGEALAASPLLADRLKFEGRIHLQFQGQGPLKLLVTQIDHRLQVRGMAKADADAHGNFCELVQGGRLALMLEPDRGTQRYQAMVPVTGERLAEALEDYYARSEQLPTLLRLHSSPQRLVGLMLQRLPVDESAESDENWQHLRALMASVEAEELGACEPEVLLRRLFHAETVRVFTPRPVLLSCRCDRASISALLLALGEEEVESVISERGELEVTCEFCGQSYAYSKLDARELFAAARVRDSQVHH